MDLGSSNVLPRYRNEGEKKFSSTSFINQHAPHLFESASADNQLVAIANNDIVDGSYASPQTKKLFTPTVQLTGHVAEIMCVKFSPCGDYLASAGFDKQVYLWDVYNHCKNFSVMKNHTNAILDLNFSADGHHIYTASADKSICVWDFATMKSVKKLREHTSVVNTCHASRRGPEMLVSGSDDGSVKVWDMRQKESALTLPSKVPITSVSFNDTADKVFIAGVDNEVKAFDLRKKVVDYALFSHTDSITGIALSTDGNFLLTNSLDQSVRCFDVRPHASGNRLLKIFQGSRHSHEKNLIRPAWNNDGTLCAAGSSDKFVYIWDSASNQIIHRLGGHVASVNDVQFSPTDRLIASVSSDKTIIIGEIPPYNL